MADGHFEIFKGKDSQFYFRLRAENGKIILGSEGYTSKSGCQNGINSVKVNSEFEDSFERREAKRGEFFFVLIAASGEVIGVSETYKSRAAMDNGIEVVMRGSPDAPVEDMT